MTSGEIKDRVQRQKLSSNRHVRSVLNKINTQIKQNEQIQRNK